MLFFEVLIAVFVGILAGSFTGLTPGVHINLVSILLVSISGYLLGFTSPVVLGSFIIAMAVTHTFLDVIPSIFLGAPDSGEMALGVLPGHKMLLKGMGYEAVRLTIMGSLLGLVCSILLIPIAIPFIPFLYDILKNWIGWILIAVMIYMIIKEKDIDAKFWSFFMFMITGVLGLFVLNLPNLEQPLFPMLSGLFGVSMLLVSLSKKVVLPKQRITENIQVSKKENSIAVGVGTACGSLVSFFPGLGPAQAAIIGSQIAGELGAASFLILVGAIGTVNMVFSLSTLYALDKARNGAIIAIMQLIEKINASDLVIFICAALIAGGIATILTLYITKIFANLMNKINYPMVCLAVIFLVTALVFYFCSWLGLLILIISTAMGVIPNVLEIKRSYSMGCLLLPVILYFVL